MYLEGGGSITFEAIQRKQIKKVFYNEFNTGVVELLKKIIKDGVKEEFYCWIDRETFKKNKDNDTWFGGLCAVVWSFGNNKDKGYLFGKDIEEDKRLMHEIVVNECEKSLKEFNKKFELNIKLREGLFAETITQRRLRICAKMRNVNIERLENLQQLTQLEQLQRIEQLQITNKSYECVNIDKPTDETIIYLDPPYKDTEEYSKGICHKEFYEWVDKITKKGFKVYISSYESHLPCVLEIKHRSTLSATSNNEVVEKLFCNIERKEVKEVKEVKKQGSLFQ